MHNAGFGSELHSEGPPIIVHGTAQYNIAPADLNAVVQMLAEKSVRSPFEGSVERLTSIKPTAHVRHFAEMKAELMGAAGGCGVHVPAQERMNCSTRTPREFMRWNLAEYPEVFENLLNFVRNDLAYMDDLTCAAGLERAHNNVEGLVIARR